RSSSAARAPPAPSSRSRTRARSSRPCSPTPAGERRCRAAAPRSSTARAPVGRPRHSSPRSLRPPSMRLEVGSRAIGPGEPCFVAAEVGINHNGDLALAHHLIDEAAAAGADGVKFQSYRTEDFLSDRSLTYEYV